VNKSCLLTLCGHVTRWRVEVGNIATETTPRHCQRPLQANQTASVIN